MEKIVLKYENGNTSFIGYKLNNLFHSKWQYFYENGKIKEEVNFNNGIRHGLCNFYNDSGILIKTLNYVNGSIEGDFIEYFDDGNVIKFKGTYLNNKLDGNFKEFDSKGKIKREGLYSSGLKFGNWVEYLEDDDFVKIINYKGGFISKINYYKNKKQTLFREEFFSITEKIDGKINKNDLIDCDEVDVYLINVLTKRILYYDNGEVFQIVKFKNGKADGLSEIFDINGNVLKSEIYKDGSLVRVF